MASDGRDRLTIDLRGKGAQLHGLAATRNMTVSACVRSAIFAMLEEAGEVEGHSDRTDHYTPVGVVKVTVRLPAAHAVLLAIRARAAEVSQGTYVADLIDGIPPSPLPPDHSALLGALIRSTDHLAVITTDFSTFLRLLTTGSPEVDRYRARFLSVVDDVRRHLALASRLAADLKAMKRSHAGSADRARAPQ